MSIKPILFNTEMVKAILDGRKTVTRRVVKPQPDKIMTAEEARSRALEGVDPYGFRCYPLDTEIIAKSHYQSGDILYVRETWKQATGDPAGGGYALFDTYVYKSDGKAKDDYPVDKLMVENRWHPSIHMPKEAARIWLKVTGVRVERLQDMKAQDSLNEGVKLSLEGIMKKGESPLKPFAQLWDSTIKREDLDRYGWAANPWVWAIEFERCEKPEGE